MKFTSTVFAAASGSMAGIVFSRNRFGQYTRVRAVPVTSTTTEALNAKARFGAGSAAWQGLTPAQQEAWRQYALTNPVTDNLGFQQALTGHQAFVGSYCHMMIATETPLDVPPVVPAPDPLLTLVFTADIGAGTFDVAYTATPLGADDKLWILGAVVDSAGMRYVKNLYKWLGLSAAAQASPWDVETQFSDRFGTLQVGQTCHVSVYVFDTVTGLLSAPFIASAPVLDTV